MLRIVEPFVAFFEFSKKYFNLGLIDTPVSINLDGDPVARVADGIHNDKDV